MSVGTEARTAHQALCARVMAVALLHRRYLLLAGVGRLLWQIGAPLLVVLALQELVPIPFYGRLPVLPLAAIGLLVWGWKYVVRPLLERFTPTRAALMVERARPGLRNRLVSALQLYPELESARPRFSLELVHALVMHAQTSTADDNFRKVVDRRPARVQLFRAGVTLALWLVLAAVNPTGLATAVRSLGEAWLDLRDEVQILAGARIVIDPLEHNVYLSGSDITIHARQERFHSANMRVRWRQPKKEKWQEAGLKVADDGRVAYLARAVREPLEVMFVSGKIQSAALLVNVTERPRIANLTVEYQLPDYVRRAPVVQPRSDGNLSALYGSVIILTIEANKPLASATLLGSFSQEPLKLNVGGHCATTIIHLDNAHWLDSAADSHETYRLMLQDNYGYDNEDKDQVYELVVRKDQAPTVSFVGLPHRHENDEPKIHEKLLGNVSLFVKAGDDWGVSRVKIFYRVENLETGEVRKQDSRVQEFALPREEIPQLNMLSLPETGAAVGERVVFWAEVEDAYNLGSQKQPHKTATAKYRIAVVSEEEKFLEAKYLDDWSTAGYRKLKVATLTDSAKAALVRGSPKSEGAATVVKKALEIAPVGESLKGADAQLMDAYTGGLNVLKGDAK